ncbi:MAG: ATP-dependent Clp protease adaptor ClpS [Proteobacteria bacterium]|nr:ATP-dependent Clp protease adaptor ClpS [Pseudomonadota bacterium]
MPEAGTIELIDTSTTNILGSPYNVIIFNDESHSCFEVTAQIIKATHCSAGKAATIMHEAHTTGRAICFSGGLERCELIEQVLAEIKLRTEIEKA